MPEIEGIIKYTLHYRPTAAVARPEVGQLTRWRTKLLDAGLMGQDPARYGGYGFGNISCRLPMEEDQPHRRAFMITGTQTGHKPVLDATDYATVQSWDISQNMITASGPAQPSSESLTHAVLYELDRHLRWVMHIHSVDLWRAAGKLGIPCTRPEIPYGSVAMAHEVQRIFAETEAATKRIFAMGGHEDGLVAFGQSPKEAAGAIWDHMAIQQAGRGGGI